MNYHQRQSALSPNVLPEHLSGIREQVLKPHAIRAREHDEVDANAYSAAILLIARSKLSETEREKLLDYIESTHVNLRRSKERYHDLIDSVISWTGWAAHWTRRRNGGENACPPESSPTTS